MMTVAAIVVGVASVTAAPAVEPVRMPATTTEAMPETIAATRAAVAAELAPPPAPVRSSQLLFAFTANQATYLRLADLQSPRDLEANDPADGDAPHRARPSLAMPRHGKLRLATDDGVQSVIGAVATRDVPAAYATWIDRKVKVDNTCEAKVIGFAVVSQVTGDASYTGDERWTIKNVLATGQPMLAARLDRCAGRFARDAALPEIVIPTSTHDAALERAARTALLGSSAARAMQRSWIEQSDAMAGVASAWTHDATITSQVLRHPGTGEAFVSVQARVAGGCGAPEANLWGLYRVVDGKLFPVQVRRLGEVETIDTLIDLEGDGELELLGKPWLGTDQILTRGNGDVLDAMTLSFVGCPC
jgi:hypothetical protein